MFQAGRLTTRACDLARRGEVGVDVMRFEAMNGVRDDEEFFRMMRDYFTPYEWASISSGWRPAAGEEAGGGLLVPADAPEGISEQLESFLWHWVIKEAVIKAIGIGLGMDLQTLEVRGLTGAGACPVTVAPRSGASAAAPCEVSREPRAWPQVDVLLSGESLCSQGWDLRVGLVVRSHPCCAVVKPKSADKPVSIRGIHASCGSVHDWG